MSDFQPGEIVDITIKGVRIAQQRADGRVEIRDEFDDPYAMPPQAAVERVAPEWWPPRPSDLLRNTSTGRFWFAVAIGSNVNLYNDRADQIDPQQAWEQRHLLTLVHREDGQDGGDRG